MAVISRLGDQERLRAIMKLTFSSHNNHRGRSLCFVLEMLNNVMYPDTYSVQAPFGGVRDWYQSQVIENKVMAILVISVSSDSSEDIVGTPAGRVILFGSIPTIILDTTLVITPPTTQTDTTVIPTETPIITPTIPPPPDYIPASLDYSLASDTESDPSEDLSSDHIPPLPTTSSFLSLADDTTDSDTPDTPPLPTHGTLFTEITFLPRDHLSYLIASLYFHSDASLDPSLRHSLSDHSSLNLPSTSTGPSRKRRRSPMTSVPTLPPASGDLSLVRADLIPSPKRVRDSGYLADVEGNRIVGVESAVTALTERVAELERDNRRLRGTTSVKSQRVDRLQRGMSRIQRELRQMR
nr:hypothetical protein [Tanacetum cinerariifolium]